MKKKIISFVLAVIMCVGMIAPIAVSASIDLPPISIKAYSPMKTQCMEKFNLTSTKYNSLCNSLYEAVKNFAEYCDITEYAINPDDSSMELVGMMVTSFPELFYVNTEFKFARKSGSTVLNRIYFTYDYTADQVTEMNKEIEAAAAELTAGIDGATFSQANIALLLHDRICTWMEYDPLYITDVEAPLPVDDFSIYGALVKKVGVCEAYAKAYMYLLSKFNIDSCLCRSNEMHHVWNVVNIDGRQYHVDLTYDDPLFDINGRVTHNYFLVSTAKMKALGRDFNDYYDSPTDTKYDNGYFWSNTESEVCVIDGVTYYYDNKNSCLKRISADGTTKTLFTDEAAIWRYSSTEIWNGNFSRIATDGEYIYFTTAKKVYKYDPLFRRIELVVEPSIAEHTNYQIYGFEIDGDYLKITMYISPAFQFDTKENYTISYQYKNFAPEGKMGDVNGDGKVNAIDCTTLKGIILGLDYTPEERIAADLNNDNKVNALDVNVLKMIILGLPV